MPFQTTFSEYIYVTTHNVSLRNYLLDLFTEEVGKKWREKRENKISKLIFSDQPKYLAITSFYRKLQDCNFETYQKCSASI